MIGQVGCVERRNSQQIGLILVELSLAILIPFLFYRSLERIEDWWSWSFNWIIVSVLFLLSCGMFLMLAKAEIYSISRPFLAKTKSKKELIFMNNETKTSIENKIGKPIQVVKYFNNEI